MERDEIEKLMKIAEKKLKKPLDSKNTGNNSLVEFIHDAQIVSHKTILVQSSVIYKRYKDYCEYHQKEVKSVRAFGDEFAKRFERVKKGHVSFYKISPEGFDISPAGIKSAKELFSGKKKKK